ncbi:MAG: DUF3332 domain-containing protein [Bacteroidetes bacterium]|nr:DUF3332 domain-containing protein [Bacteroidota bacterium]
MKKFSRLLILSSSLVGMLLQSGCYGSFKLIGKVYEWNGSIEDKFVRSIVFWALCIIPVYAIAGFVDAVILNVIEFWSGSNPVSMKEGEYEQQVVQYRGKTYRMEATMNKFTVTEVSGRKAKKPVELVFKPSDLSWNLVQDQQLVAISRLECTSEGKVGLRVFSPTGKSTLLPYTEQTEWAAFTDHFNGESARIAQHR